MYNNVTMLISVTVYKIVQFTYWGKLLIKVTIDIICLCAFVGINCSIKQKCTVNAT
jgi:hypothetical protein